MAEQFWIGGFYIDLSRNQIRQNGQTQTLAPKALAVLTHLAKNQGQVVSQDALLDAVWQDTIVSPNTLQRSIAQLRKALGDDGKVQVYIKTHAKKGYSLECDVHWHGLDEQINTTKFELSLDDTPENSENHQDLIVEKNQIADGQKALFNGVEILKWPVVIIFVLLSFILISFFLQDLNKTDKLSISEFRALTATDNKEFGGAYSPNGKYLVFSRYEDLLCQNNIWAKNLETQQESKLTQDAGAYSGHAFSKDGERVIFISEQDCTKPITQKKCYTLYSLDFSKSLTNAEPFTELMECKNSAIKKPSWLNNNDIALLQKNSERWSLISYSIEENSSQTLFEVTRGNIVDYVYSTKDDVIALTSVNEVGEYILNILKPSGEVISSNKIQLPDNVAKFRAVRPNFTSNKQQLIFSTGRRLFTLSYTGEVNPIDLPLDRPMGTPKLHPAGNKMMAVTGHYDADVISIPLHNIKNTNVEPDGRVIARSTTGEYNALVQPHGQLIAFKSKRSGEEQIWLTGSEGTWQLTQFPIDAFIMGISWASNGDSLLANVDHQLVQVYLDGTIKYFTLTNAVERLFTWNSQQQIALALLRIEGVEKFVEINLSTQRFHVINDKSINWAVKTDQGKLLYTDHLDRFWLQGPIEAELVEVLNEQGSDKRFIAKGEVIYGVNDKHQLWSYSFESTEFDIVGRLPNNLDHITDVDDKNFFGVVRVSAKKELVELVIK